MHNFVHDMLHASPAALRIEALWKVRPPGLLLTPPSTSMRRRGLQEYEQGAIPEAKFVKDLDRLEMALQGASFRIGAFAPTYSLRLQPTSTRKRTDAIGAIYRASLTVACRICDIPRYAGGGTGWRRRGTGMSTVVVGRSVALASTLALEMAEWGFNADG